MFTSCITLTGLNHYYGRAPFKPGRIIRLEKEPDNSYDSEAIRAVLPFIDKVGYVANSTNTVYDGTISAGRLYDRMDNHAYAKVLFVTHSSVIAQLLDKESCKRYDAAFDETDDSKLHLYDI